MRTTGKLDSQGIEIKEGDIIFYPSHNTHYKIHFGEGTYDSGYYTYIGFYCEELNNSLTPRYPDDRERGCDGYG